MRVVDAVDRYAAEFLTPAIKANGLYEGKYPMVSGLARPCIVEEVVQVAREVGASVVAHGCTGKGNDQVRFEVSFGVLAPDLEVLAPIRDANIPREKAIVLAEEWGIPIASVVTTYSVDENVWGRTAECGPLEDPWVAPPEDAFERTAPPERRPTEPAEITVTFEGGVPVALDGETVALPELIRRLDVLGGSYGFGRVDMIENRRVGIKSRELYEVPGALAIIRAHQALEDLTLERDLAHHKPQLEQRWADLVYDGQWFSPLRAAIDAYVDATQAQRDRRGATAVRAGLVHGRRPQAASARSTTCRSRPTEAATRSTSPTPRATCACTACRSRCGRRSRERRVTDERGGLRCGPDASRRRRLPRRTRSGRSLHVRRASRVGRRRRLDRARARPAATPACSTPARGTPSKRRSRRSATTSRPGRFVFHDADEDIHSAIERGVTDRLGDLGAKLHAGRSRNDLVVTDLRLWLLAAGRRIDGLAVGLVDALIARAREHAATVMPGTTHARLAQPVTLGHHLLAHAWALARDLERLAGVVGAHLDVRRSAPARSRRRRSVSTRPRPRSASACAGRSRNSIDAVSDRDFVQEFLAVAAICATHLSRLAADLARWTDESLGWATARRGLLDRGRA